MIAWFAPQWWWFRASPDSGMGSANGQRLKKCGATPFLEHRFVLLIYKALFGRH
jgi:hypothetical protein